MSEHGPQAGGVVHPTSYKQASNSEYITAEDLQGRPVTVTISEVLLVVMEGEDGKASNRFVYRMRGKDRKWVSNATNNACLQAMFGDDPQAVVGKRVTLIPEQVRVGGKPTLGIRVSGSPDLPRDTYAMVPAGRGKKRRRDLTVTRTGSDPAPAREPGE